MIAPLRNKRIIVTREDTGGKIFSNKINQFGGIPIEVPLLQVGCHDCDENKQIIKQLERFDWFIFTSANGVQCFFRLADKHQVSHEILKSKKIAVVGEKTNQKLMEYGYSADIVPSVYDADTLSKEFLSENQKPGEVLLIRGNLSRDVLPNELTKASIPFKNLYVYKTTLNSNSKHLLNDTLQTEFDFITFTSPSTIDAYFELSGYLVDKPCVCIGTTTENKAKEKGFSNILTPKVFTVDAMIDIMIDYINKKEHI
ncbi:uroporphyrinogen-III synthase [Oceanobacillus sp. Castelsardo]|uniref:uroporphyrinogen-III synthase n=1 Tax=Oceanobacillus sp. Castelsardo TaxID=1851204 RepID=UPI0008396481|nr:uroporphyrinogen-III synthase [Oceanobacillus sp. Castelsardo]